ncbi:hypothetical protein [Mycobacterium seoulense]|uniref:hypothetical protein n=1 Tax=Mycobacterium seoulense TaxID=386911 RepID=UPI001E3EAD51|nr:hypothetical protein [Mycobacterium seoulense]
MSATAERYVVTRTIAATPAEIFALLVDHPARTAQLLTPKRLRCDRRSGYQFDSAAWQFKV